MNIKLNENFKMLGGSYLFSEIAARVGAYRAQNPSKRVISLGIGDVTRPLAPSVATEMSRAARKMSTRDGFVGYGDTQGAPELRSAISKRYEARGISLNQDEIFISDGAKSDLGNLFDILGDNEIVIFDPIYPVYLDSAIISGRKVRFLSANEGNSFLPSPASLPKKAFVIFLCSPNNPCGTIFTREGLGAWVDFALESGSLIAFDAAYESYIGDASLPHSIFEINGAKKCAVEVCSFSKMAGFTGVRCGWTVIPGELPIHSLWKRRQSTKFNGASIISQRGALACLSPLGVRENQGSINYYMENSRLLADFLKKKGIFFVGGENAPYLWVKQPNKMGSWEFFHHVLHSSGIVITPGEGFGKSGRGFFRISAFASRKDVLEAIERLNVVL